MKRVPLYERLPEIYRLKDLGDNNVIPAGQLKTFLESIEKAFGLIHENIEDLYHDFFIETSNDWVIHYIGDLLGTSILKGKEWNLRADVADTIKLRRRKGTISAIELLTFNLSQWSVLCVEIRDRLVWTQNLNHQRLFSLIPGVPITLSEANNNLPRGGTVAVRNPSALSLINTPYDPYAHHADLKKIQPGNLYYNLPNLAVFVWRLKTYTVPVTRPVFNTITDRGTGLGADQARFIVRFYIHPLGIPCKLFNNKGYDPEEIPQRKSRLENSPHPIIPARLSHGTVVGDPANYVSINTYDETGSNLPALENAALQFHLPQSMFDGLIFPPEDPDSANHWSFRGENLCAWEEGLDRAMEDNEVAIDPIIGRVIFAFDKKPAADALRDFLLVTYTYASVGPVGAHPISRNNTVSGTVDYRSVNFHQNPNGLRDALNNIQDSANQIIVEIQDSMVHDLDLSTISNGTSGANDIRLSSSLIIRAADNQRPIIRLARPLKFRPKKISESGGEAKNLLVRLEGLYITKDENWDTNFSTSAALIEKAALNRLEIVNCTLNPGGNKLLDGSDTGGRASAIPGIRLRNNYMLSGDDRKNFGEIPEIILQNSICGSLFIDSDHLLWLKDTIVDSSSKRFAISGAKNFSRTWGPELVVEGTTIFGKLRVKETRGNGGVWLNRLVVLNHQKGCIKFSYFSGNADKLPQNHGCVSGTDSRLGFTSKEFGAPAYAQILSGSDFRILERGPQDDQMGAYGFLKEAHTWRNLKIRYREFMPAGTRELIIPVN